MGIGSVREGGAVRMAVMAYLVETGRAGAEPDQY